MKQYALWIVAIGFSLGVLGRSFFDWGPAPSILILVCMLACLVLYVVYSKQTAFLIAILGLCSVVVGVARFSLDDALHAPDIFLTRHIESSVMLEGVVTDEPEDRGTYTRLVVDVEVVVVGREITPTHDRVLVYAPRYPRVSYGDQVRITGVLREPEPIVQNDERVFLFQEYLKKDNIHFQISYPELEVRAHKRTSSLRGVLFEIKETFLSALRSVMPEPYVSLLGGLVVGAKESLGTELLDRFRAVGIVHIVVLSGYNVAVIARVVMNALAPLPRVLGWGIGSIFILLFTIMTGGSATIVRASIMTLLVFIAEAAGRKFDALRALIVAVLCMVIQTPRILAFDPSFQLSFLATFGLVTLSPYMEHLLRWVPIRFGIRNILAATLSTELAVLPLLLWMTGIFSVVAPIVNVLVLPTVPLAMFGGFVTGVVALVSTTLALPFSIITYALLAYQLFVVNLFSDLPFVALHLPHVSVTVMFVVYGFLFILFRKQFFQRKKE